MKRSFETIQVREVMTDSPVSVRADDSLQRALDLIDKHQVHELPVLESGRCIGIVTAGDLKLLTPAYPLFPVQEDVRQALHELKVATAMTIEPETISPEASVLEAVKRLHQLRIESLLVTEGDKLLGVLSVSDILRLVIAEYEPPQTD
jgi:acetoin utilization protein AcuB